MFGGSEKLDVSWDKGLYDSNVLVAYRRPRPEWLAQQSFVLQVGCCIFYDDDARPCWAMSLFLNEILIVSWLNLRYLVHV